MSGVEWVQKAMQTDDPAAADRLLLEAIRVDPDLGQAYALRARLAVMRGDAVAAAHHFRVAYARGDRSPETRVGLAFCLAAAAQGDLAGRVREGIPVPPSLADFEDSCEFQARPIRQVMAVPLPPKGEPALLPGEKLPPAPESGLTPTASVRATAEQASLQIGAAASPAPAAAVRVVRAPLPAESTVPAVPEGTGRFTGERRAVTLPPVPPPPVSLPPLPSVAVSAASAITATIPGVPAMSLRRRLPDWIDQIDRTEVAPPAAPVAEPDWLTNNVAPADPAAFDGAIELSDDDGAMVVSQDPGAPDFSFRSPVTGRLVRPEDVARERADGRMPTLEPIPDLLARAPIFADLIDTRRLFAALELPGPVLTVAGAPPRPLCRTMAFGATQEELFFRDIEREGLPPVRLNRAAIARMDVVNDDQQISFVLGDGRQLHLDLRALARTHSPTVRQLVRRLRELFPEAP